MRRVYRLVSAIYPCGCKSEARKDESDLPPTCPQHGWAAARYVVTERVEDGFGVRVTRHTTGSTLSLTEGSAGQAILEFALSEALPPKLEPLKKMGVLNDVELNVLDKALYLLREQSLDRLDQLSRDSAPSFGMHDPSFN